MRLARRLSRSVLSLRYRFVPTEELIARVSMGDSEGAKHALIEIIKERLAHQDGSLEGLNWKSLNLSKAMLSASKMPRAQFAGAKLPGAYFGYCDLRAASFERADLREAHFREADLAEASFVGANLADANFARAQLRACSFQAADLSGANLWGADLRGADFAAAKLVNCCLTAALIDESTRLPVALPLEASGAANKESGSG